MALQHLRSNTASKRPTAAAMADGQLAVNTNAGSAGLFFKDADGNIVKTGPAHVGTSAPNSSPAAGGSTGNSTGELWLDTTGGNYVLKVYDGTAWRDDLVSLASGSNDGLLSSSDFTKLSGIATGAEVNVDTNLSYTASTRVLASSTGTNATLPNVVAGGNSGLMTGADKTKLDGIATGAEVNVVDSVAGKTGAVTLVKGDVGLGNVDNTSDANKPISSATQTALNGKATSAQGALADSALQPGDNISTLTNNAGYITNADGGNAATLDGIDSSQFVRSDAADVKTSGDLRFNDDVKVSLGTGNDFALYYNGADAYMDMNAASDNIYIRNSSDATVFTFDSAGSFTIAGDLLPDTDNTGNVGTTSLTWNDGQFTNLTIDSTLSVRGAIDLADNDILRLGSGDDVEFFFNGSNCYLDLNSGGNNFIIRDGTTTRFTFDDAGHLTLAGDLLPDTDNTGNVGTSSLTWSDGQFTDLSVNGTLTAHDIDNTGRYVSSITAVSALAIDCASGNYFTKTINANSTFTFTNVPSSRAFSFTLELTHTSGTVTWPSSVEFPGDTAPTLTTGKTHLFMFVTDDGGTRFRAASLVDYDN